MSRFIVLAVAIALAPTAWGQLYKYVDKDGKVVYTDQPPANTDSKVLKAPPPAPAASTKGAAESTPAKARTATTQAAAPAKTDQVPLTAEQKAERCLAARANYAIFLDGGEITMRDTRTGERTVLDQNQLPAETAKAKAAMEAACKKD
jgi:Domain of unknown function (DUF4124)